jgi:hypothetical protein
MVLHYRGLFENVEQFWRLVFITQYDWKPSPKSNQLTIREQLPQEGILPKACTIPSVVFKLLSTFP